jgi:hypothetical protein
MILCSEPSVYLETLCVPSLLRLVIHVSVYNELALFPSTFSTSTTVTNMNPTVSIIGVHPYM